jgi:hypothetical protein
VSFSVRGFAWMRVMFLRSVAQDLLEIYVVVGYGFTAK